MRNKKIFLILIITICIILSSIFVFSFLDSKNPLTLSLFEVDPYNSTTAIVKCNYCLHISGNNRFNSATATIYIYDLELEKYIEIAFGKVSSDEYDETEIGLELQSGENYIQITSLNNPHRLIILNKESFSQNTWSSIQLGLAKWKIEASVQIYDNNENLISFGNVFYQ